MIRKNMMRCAFTVNTAFFCVSSSMNISEDKEGFVMNCVVEHNKKISHTDNSCITVVTASVSIIDAQREEKIIKKF